MLRLDGFFRKAPAPCESARKEVNELLDPTYVEAVLLEGGLKLTESLYKEVYDIIQELRKKAQKINNARNCGIPPEKIAEIKARCIQEIQGFRQRIYEIAQSIGFSLEGAGKPCIAVPILTGRGNSAVAQTPLH